MLSLELMKVAKENGYELKKVLKNCMGYCFEYSLVKSDDIIYLGYKSDMEECFISEDEIIERIKNGKSQEEIETEELLNDYAEKIEKEMLA